MVRRQLAALLGDRVAAAAGREDRRCRVDLVLAARARQPFSAGSSSRSGEFGTTLDVARLGRLAQRLRDRVPRAVADLEQALLRRAAAAGEPVAAVLPRELDAELLEPVDRAGRLGGQHLDEAQSAVSCERARRPRRAARASRLRRTAAWIPPCAFAELQDWSEPFVATATRAPARSAETAAARPEAPLPITSTSKEASGTSSEYTESRSINAVITITYLRTPIGAAPRSRSGLAGRGFAWLPAALRGRRGERREVAPPARRSRAGASGRRARELLDPRRRIVARRSPRRSAAPPRGRPPR